MAQSAFFRGCILRIANFKAIFCTDLDFKFSGNMSIICEWCFNLEGRMYLENLETVKPFILLAFPNVLPMGGKAFPNQKFRKYFHYSMINLFLMQGPAAPF